MMGPVARSDYEAVVGLEPDPGPASLLDLLQRAKFGPWGNIQYLPSASVVNGAQVAFRRDGKLRNVTDGLTQTVLVGERSGRPDYYRDGRLVAPYPYNDPAHAPMDSQQAAWAVSTHFPQLLYSPKQAVNSSNADGLFAFHGIGANVALADGSVRLIATSTETSVLNAMMTSASADGVQLE